MQQTTHLQESTRSRIDAESLALGVIDQIEAGEAPGEIAAAIVNSGVPESVRSGIAEILAWETLGAADRPLAGRGRVEALQRVCASLDPARFSGETIGALV